MLSFLFHSEFISTVATDQYSLLEKQKQKQKSTNQPNKQNNAIMQSTCSIA